MENAQRPIQTELDRISFCSSFRKSVHGRFDFGGVTGFGFSCGRPQDGKELDAGAPPRAGNSSAVPKSHFVTRISQMLVSDCPSSLRVSPTSAFPSLVSAVDVAKKAEMAAALVVLSQPTEVHWQFLSSA